MGSILDRARKDMRSIVNGGFSTELTITPTGLGEFVINGLSTKHSLTFDTDGLPILGDNSHCSFSEIDLNELGVVTRDSKMQLNIRGWKVKWTDAIGTFEYKMDEPWPDNTLGLVKVTLSQVKAV